MEAPFFDLDDGLRADLAAIPLALPHQIPVVLEDGINLVNVPAAPPAPPPIILGQVANAEAAPGILQLQGQPLLDRLRNYQYPYAPEPDVEPPVDEDDDEVLADELAPLGHAAPPPVIQDQTATAAAAPGQEVASASQLQGRALLDHPDNVPESKRRRTEEQAGIMEPGLWANNALAAGPSTITEESQCVFNTIDPLTEESLQEESVPPPPEIEYLHTEEMLSENLPKQFVSNFSPASTSTDGSEPPETVIEPSLDPLKWKGKAVESPKEASIGAGPSGSSTEEQPIREGSPVPAQCD